jgi:hypothetical protein
MARIPGGAVLLIVLAQTGCGYPPPREVRPGLYELNYCDEERKCFEAAEKVCPQGYRITKYGSLRPEQFVCESQMN